jgi:hypothetical protein
LLAGLASRAWACGRGSAAGTNNPSRTWDLADAAGTTAIATPRFRFRLLLRVRRGRSLFPSARALHWAGISPRCEFTARGRPSRRDHGVGTSAAFTPPQPCYASQPFGKQGAATASTLSIPFAVSVAPPQTDRMAATARKAVARREGLRRMGLARQRFQHLTHPEPTPQTHPHAPLAMHAHCGQEGAGPGEARREGARDCGSNGD